MILLTYRAFLLAAFIAGIWRYAGWTDSFRFAGGAMIAGILVAIGPDFLPIRHSGSIAVLYALLLINLFGRDADVVPGATQKPSGCSLADRHRPGVGGGCRRNRNRGRGIRFKDALAFTGSSVSLMGMRSSRANRLR